jgi:hypothetical protein
VSEERFQPNLITSDADAGRAIAKASSRALGNSFAGHSRLAA